MLRHLLKTWIVQNCADIFQTQKSWRLPSRQSIMRRKALRSFVGSIAVLRSIETAVMNRCARAHVGRAQALLLRTMRRTRSGPAQACTWMACVVICASTTLHRRRSDGRGGRRASVGDHSVHSRVWTMLPAAVVPALSELLVRGG
jgi:hypothetical protein